ncbi:two-component sensor histidine kinase [Streptomyces cirratus]|uniref:histidine kinase n=1 Tax=Streptomyces cirratus TaxID=68187 RepID=A0ABQ3EWH0_9ACTN|nr:sensor histidine kinase [Streptomyces cirratus]GHB55836.1 two-component sensor histidine kinase [Streptomyces cirratus]
MAELRRHGAARWTGRAGRGGHGGLPWRSSLLVAVIAVAGSGWAGRLQPGSEPLGVTGRVLLLTGPALLVLRHRRPVPVLAGVCAVTLAYLAGGYPYGPVFISVALACLAAVLAGHRYAAWTAAALLWTGHLLIGHWLYRWLPPPGDGPAGWGTEAGVTAWVAAVLAACELIRLRREQWARDRAERAAAEHRRAGEERLRIARELHDVLAHSLSVIHVQAGVGLALLDSDREQARTALTTIKAASKEALGEVRQVLDTLRAPGEAPRAPAPGLGRLDELVAQAASAGLTVTVEGEPGALPAATDLAAFRIVQEALTNVVRHSASRTARVRIARGPGRLELGVDDDGPATGDEAGGSGTGLIGMRERAAAQGGTMEAGPRPDGGFRVLARLPLTGPASPVPGEDR